MTIAAYNELIRNLPYLDQAFETKQASWQRECKNDKRFKILCSRLFNSQSSIKLSRRDCFSKTQDDFEEALVSIIFWGYPRNMRGNTFSGILKSLQRIQEVLSVQKQLKEAEFEVLCQKLKNTGLGLSTLSKVLYFFRFTINKKPCLILDSRIIEVLQNELFDELKPLSKINEFNKMRKYAEYLDRMQNIAKQNGYKPDQLEFFLFHFGKILKA